MTELITRLEDVRVGDIFLGPIGGLLGLGVGLGELLVDGGFRVGSVDVRHAGIVVRAAAAHPGWTVPELAQAMPRGAEIATMTREKHWTDRCLYARLPEDYPGQARDAAMVARDMVRAGVAYSFASYPALALQHWTGGWPTLDRWVARTREFEGVDIPVEAICSVFVDQAWTIAGKQVMPEGTKRQAVTPSSLATVLLQTEGITLGWPGFHRYPG